MPLFLFIMTWVILSVNSYDMHCYFATFIFLNLLACSQFLLSVEVALAHPYLS